jgi:hypothetical protein
MLAAFTSTSLKGCPMISAKCPECSNKMQAPDDFAGRRVKCGKCGHNFVLGADESGASKTIDFFVETVPPPPSAAGSGGTKSTSVFQANKHEAGSSATRYPLLAFYLRIIRIGAILLAIGGAIVAVLMMLGGLMMAMQTETSSGGIQVFFSGLAVAAGTFLEVFGALAVIQFVSVILDMEQHLRSIAQRAPDFSSH